ncbi:MAG: SDR family NAD(P)-dependent oxidoreductase [Bacteroidaceae bacterium]|nr:SDR family NAD(P)-dependent oxidoreductase [Bacteroidaceae bacterium]
MKVLIIGASSGMGFELAKLMLQDGHTLGLAARRTQPLMYLQSAYPQQVKTSAIDVTADDAPQKIMSLIEELGGIDLYFHSSGIGKQNWKLDATIEEATLRTNALGFTQCIGTVFRFFASRPEGGHIACISSIAGTKGLGAAPSYSATKAFQNCYIQALEQQANMRHLPIRFTDIRPGFVNTVLLNDSHHYPMLIQPEKAAQQIYKALLRKRHVFVLDWRYRLLVPLWRLLPNALWRRLPIHTRDGN